MKKFLVVFVVLSFFVVSCSDGSKSDPQTDSDAVADDSFDDSAVLDDSMNDEELIDLDSVAAADEDNVAVSDEDNVAVADEDNVAVSDEDNVAVSDEDNIVISDCKDEDSDGKDGYDFTYCKDGTDKCDSDEHNWTVTGCSSCVDGDSDGYGENCDKGTDCDDENSAIHEGCCTNECDTIGTTCTGTTLSECTLGMDGCNDLVETTCTSGFCAVDGLSCGECDNKCEIGDSICTAGNIKSCETDTFGCLDYGTETACASGNCQDGETCEPICTENDTQTITCPENPAEFQKQTCNAEGIWEDDGACYAVPSYVIPTNQTTCYNNSSSVDCPSEGEDFCGQDAQYPDAVRTFSVSGDEVTDSMTGLIWQRILPETYSGCTGGDPVGSTCKWQEAIDYCDGLGGGWRLPTVEELSTLPDYGKHNPAIDETAFPDTPSTYFWSSTTLSHNTGYAWDVNFNFAHVFYGYKTDNYSVRCVKGENYSVNSTFVESGGGEKIVTDTKTGLIWTKNYESSKTWQQALSYCEKLDYAGQSDWRLPNVNELKTLINYSKHNPASDFPDMPSNYFWSSTTVSYSTVTAWLVYFYRGNVNSSDKTHNDYVRCVR